MEKKKVKITLYFENFEIDVENGETILEAALRNGYDPPFSCQLGACSTCRAKLLTGEVVMDENDALTDDEVKDGYILTCQSHLVTDFCHVNYDE